MSMPGFTAEAACYRSAVQYRASASGARGAGVTPQQSDISMPMLEGADILGMGDATFAAGPRDTLICISLCAAGYGACTAICAGNGACKLACAVAYNKCIKNICGRLVQPIIV